MDWPARSSTTSSSTVDTDGSTPGDVEIVPMPRMKMVRSLLDELVRKSALGTWARMSCTLLRLSRLSCAALSTVMATGTFCNGSDRRRAVTTMFSNPCPPASAAGLLAVLGGVCACTIVEAKVPVSSRHARKPPERAGDRNSRSIMCFPHDQHCAVIVPYVIHTFLVG